MKQEQFSFRPPTPFIREKKFPRSHISLLRSVTCQPLDQYNSWKEEIKYGHAWLRVRPIANCSGPEHTAVQAGPGFG